jgi:hypothetical protein
MPAVEEMPMYLLSWIILWATIAPGIGNLPDRHSATNGLRPFDLTYMPRATHSVIAIRPAELLKQTDGLDKTATAYVRKLLAAGFAFLDGDIKAAELPVLANVDQVILSANLTIGIEPEKDGKSNYGLGGISSGLVRTIKPFDWTGHIKKWFPKVEVVRHAGRDYLRIPIALGEKPSYIALLAADDRTLAFDSDEDEIKNLLSRLKKKSPPVRPAGWDEVARELIAISHDMTAEGWFTAPPKPQRGINRAVVEAVHNLKEVAIGISVGDASTIRVIATAGDEADARRAATAFKSLLEEMGSEEFGDPLISKFIENITVERNGRIIRAVGKTPGNVFRLATQKPDAE